MTAAQRLALRRRRRRQQHAQQQQLAASRAASVRQRRQRRNITATSLKGATEFSSDPVLSDPAAVIRLFKTFAPAACLALISRTTPVRDRGCAGAPRIEGSWALVFLAHIMAGDPDWQHWYHRNRDSGLWREAGFETVPAFQTVHLRFSELEDPRYRAAFEDVAYKFVRIAARNAPHAFDFVHIDGSPAHSHSRLQHACPNPDFCQTRQGRAPRYIQRASEEAINEDRHQRSADAEPENPDAAPDNRMRKLSDEQAQELGLPDWRNSRYFELGDNGHIMRCRDKHIGVRAYVNGPRSRKVWTGGYFLPAVSDFFWAPFALHFFEADIQEHLGWPDLHRKVMTALNENPDAPTHRITAVVADRAFTNKTFIGFNTNEGIASITPQRKLPGGREWECLRDPQGRWDEHSPRCKYCGGPSDAYRRAGEGFAINGAGDPRISFRCALGWTPDCDRLQTISCRHEYRALLPIDRRQRVFHDLLQAHSSFEGVFDAWRDRYAVSGNSNATRSKRRGSISAQRLRGAAALLAEWFRICLRMGYVGNHSRRNPHLPQVRTGGAQRLWKVRVHRREHLNLPLGPAASRNNLVFPPAPPPAASPPTA